ncbi:MAG: YfcE family phosphodiesterase [Patescibacteria group bacterium]|nr:YfcE family phosphodiesterase [Patescibacteria group bacterium]
MKIAILSDLHDNYKSWQIINKNLKEGEIKTIFFCGDLAAPSMLKKMIEEFEGKIYMVYGNVADQETEKELADKSDKVNHYGDLAEFELNGKKIAMIHFSDKAKELASSHKYDLVCFGHNHAKSFEKNGDTYLLNPGTAGGMFQYPSFAIFDLENMTNKFKDITL